MQISRCSSREISEISEGRANYSARIGCLGYNISVWSLIISYAVMGKKCKNFDIASGFYLAGVCSEILGTIFLIHSMVPSYIKFANEKEIPKKNFFAVWWASGKSDAEEGAGDSVDKTYVFKTPLYITGLLVCSIAIALVGMYWNGCDEVLENRLAGPNLEG